MAARCELCGKTVMFGHRVSHSHRLSKRKWKPNLHRVTVVVNGKKVKMRLCTKCLRKVRKA